MITKKYFRNRSLRRLKKKIADVELDLEISAGVRWLRAQGAGHRAQCTGCRAQAKQVNE